MNAQITFEVQTLSSGAVIAWCAGSKPPAAVAFGTSAMDAIRRLCEWTVAPPEAQEPAAVIELGNTSVLLCVQQ